MVSAHMLEPVDYLDINSVVLLFVVLCYTLLPPCVHGFNIGVAPTPSSLFVRGYRPTLQDLGFDGEYTQPESPVDLFFHGTFDLTPQYGYQGAGRVVLPLLCHSIGIDCTVATYANLP